MVRLLGDGLTLRIRVVIDNAMGLPRGRREPDDYHVNDRFATGLRCPDECSVCEVDLYIPIEHRPPDPGYLLALCDRVGRDERCSGSGPGDVVGGEPVPPRYVVKPSGEPGAPDVAHVGRLISRSRLLTSER